MTVEARGNNLIAFGDRAPATTAGYREQPHNLEAEQALLGAILVNNEAAHQVAGFLAPQHFFQPVHGRIFEHAMEMIERSQYANPVTLKSFFARDDALAEVGGASYLDRLAASVVSVVNAEAYGRAIHDCFLRRELITVGETIVATAYDSTLDEPATHQIENAEQSLFHLAEDGRPEGGLQAFRESLLAAITSIEAAYKADGRLVGVSTGLHDLDKKLGGLHRSDLIVIAGRPSMGKTALATNIAFSAAKSFKAASGQPGSEYPEGAVVAFFSLEMSAEQIASRILSDVARIPSQKLLTASLGNDDFLRFTQASIEVEAAPLWIDDTPALSVPAIWTRARRLKRQQGLGLIVVDYLQLMRPAGGRGSGSENRVQEISEITRSLKAMAKDLEVPVIALSQLSRAPEMREDKRPMLSDLRESGSIEQDADVVLLLYREEYYLERRQPPQHGGEQTEEHRKWQEEMEKVHSVAEVIIGKQRHGPTGTVSLHFDAEFTHFGNLERERFSSAPPPF